MMKITIVLAKMRHLQKKENILLLVYRNRVFRILFNSVEINVSLLEGISSLSKIGEGNFEDLSLEEQIFIDQRLSWQENQQKNQNVFQSLESIHIERRSNKRKIPAVLKRYADSISTFTETVLAFVIQRYVF